MFRIKGRQIYSVLCCAAALCCATVQAQAVQTSAASAILVEAESGRVLYEQNADQKMLIASTTKIMTALMAIESCDLDEIVEVKQSHMVEGSSMYLKPGEKLTLETLLYGLMLCSGNDAALAVADHCGPGVDAFVQKMNCKAKELGMMHTSFANPNGLDNEAHYSTARDMAVLASYAMANETFARIVSTRTITIGDRTMVNHNKLLSRYEGCVGLKTGYTKAAGRTLVSCAVRDDMKLIAVTLKDSNDWADHAALYDYGFETYHMEHLAVPGQTAMQIPVLNSCKKSVPILYGTALSYPIKNGEKIQTEIETESSIFVPIAEGEKAGKVRYTLNNEDIGCVDLHYGAQIEPLQVQARGVFWKVANACLK